MVKGLFSRKTNHEAAEKQISLTVLPQGVGSQDIHVEVKRNLTVGRRRSQRRFAAFLFLVMFLLLFPMGRDYLVYLRMREDYADLLRQNQELVQQKEILEDERDALYSHEVIERLAREDLDMVLPGESKVYHAIPTSDIPKRENIRSGEAFH
ncbi:MAG: septum formation initiator family protein [Clostridiales bacterium]|nr:septum formation initiator family protein [Clostridiales bacterium]